MYFSMRFTFNCVHRYLIKASTAYSLKCEYM